MTKLKKETNNHSKTNANIFNKVYFIGGREIKLKNFITMIFLFFFGLFIVFKYINQNRLLKNHSCIKGKLTRVGYSGGRRVGTPECEYEYFVNEKLFKGVQKISDKLNLEVGDSIIIIYSIEDPSTSKVEFKNGLSSCDEN